MAEEVAEGYGVFLLQLVNDELEQHTVPLGQRGKDLQSLGSDDGEEIHGQGEFLAADLRRDPGGRLQGSDDAHVLQVLLA